MKRMMRQLLVIEDADMVDYIHYILILFVVGHMSWKYFSFFFCLLIPSSPQSLVGVWFTIFKTTGKVYSFVLQFYKSNFTTVNIILPQICYSKYHFTS